MSFNFFRTIKIFAKNPYVNIFRAIIKHILWQFRKLFDLFPCRLRLEKFSIVIENKSVANGCGALINAMGYYDGNNMRLLKEIFAQKWSEVFFDIGGNIGVYSLLAGTCHAMVYAFEPHPYTCELLRNNIELNRLEKNVFSFDIALSHYSGHAFLSDIPASSTNKIMNRKDNCISVTTIAGRDFCRNNNIIPDIIKIDVEGHEYSVLQGFAEILRSVSMILIESEKITKIGNLLAKYDFYGPYKIDYRNRIFDKNFHSYEDWIFVRGVLYNVLIKNGFSYR